MHECRERREAQERPLFALRVDNFSGREWALHSSAPRARTRGEADQEEGPVDLPPCFAGFAMEGEPRLSSKARTAKRRKVRVKKAWMDFFNNLLVLRPINNFIYGWTFSTTC